MSAPAIADIIPGWDVTAEQAARLDTDLLVRAYRFSEKAHAGQTRRNGDPYVTHCVQVAKILAPEPWLTVAAVEHALHAESEPVAPGATP